jgi:hypothetical protein
MKMKYFGLFFMFLILAAAVQPICAADYTKTTIHLYDQYGNDLEEYNITKYNNIMQFKASLYKIDESQAMRYLDFYIYKLNPDESNKIEYYHTRKMTNLFGTATTPKIQFEQGDYILLVTYGGNERSKLSPSNATVKIHVT